MGVGMARLGQPTQKIVYGSLKELRTVDFGPPLHSMALVGEVHPLEQELLDYFKVTDADRNSYKPPEETEESDEPPY